MKDHIITQKTPGKLSIAMMVTFCLTIVMSVFAIYYSSNCGVIGGDPTNDPFKKTSILGVRTAIRAEPAYSHVKEARCFPRGGKPCTKQQDRAYEAIVERMKRHTDDPFAIGSASGNRDINEHLPALMEYASQSEVVMELGVRDGSASWAFLAGRPKMYIGVDLKRLPETHEIEKMALKAGIEYRFIVADDLLVNLCPVDFIFIDTWHSYMQLKTELELHSWAAKKYIGFHDVETFGERDENNEYSVPVSNYLPSLRKSKKVGLMTALNEFLKEESKC